METELYKVRSLGGCLKAAFDLLRTNLKTIFRRTWLSALIIAVLGAAVLVLYTHSSTVLATVMTAVVSLLMYAAYAWFFTIIISLLNGQSVKVNLPRMIRLALFVLAIGIAAGIIMVLLSFIPFVGVKSQAALIKATSVSGLISLVAVLVYMVALLPLTYAIMKYCIETKSKVMSIIKKPYATGWRHWGYIFMAGLLSGIIILIIYMIVSLPSSITLMSDRIDKMGILMGDPSGLPGYFSILLFVSALVSTFVMVYVMSWSTMVSYYIYGHIEAKEKLSKEPAVVTEPDGKTPELDFEEIK